MATRHNKYSLEYAVDFCTNSDESDIDSSTGGLSSDEEEKLDELLAGGDEILERDNVCPVENNNDDSESITSNDLSSGDESESEVMLTFCNDTNIQIIMLYQEESSSSASNADTSNAPHATRRLSNSPPPPSPPLQPPPKRLRQSSQKKKSNPVNNTILPTSNSYNTLDDHRTILPDFQPARLPGSQIPNHHHTRNIFVNPLQFFQLYFTADIVNSIVTHTNAYAWTHVGGKSSYGDKNGAWQETNVNEIWKLIALLIYQGFVKVSSFSRYWSTKSLYHGLWAREFMSRNRFCELVAFLHVVDPGREDQSSKLRKVDKFIAHMREKCKQLYQPYQQVSIDERLVKSKHRSGIRQYIANKPVKFGLKLWVLADSITGYTYDFLVYTGKTEVSHENGLGYSVVMKLAEPLYNQGYHLFFDNFYTSVKLLNDLLCLGIPACGTTCENRKGFPQNMKNGKQWAKGKDRGEMRWDRDDHCLAVQWIDNKVVTILSTIDTANKYLEVERKVKRNQQWGKMTVKKPYVIQRYNMYMNGVDRSDQLLAKYNLLRKCIRWWKTLFFHAIDIAVVNSFLLFKDHQKKYPDVKGLKRGSAYSLLEFREELVRNIMNFDEFSNPPAYRTFDNTSQYTSQHLPEYTEERRHCIVCYKKEKKQFKIRSRCNAPQCNVYLHITTDKNCFAEWHTAEFHRKFR